VAACLCYVTVFDHEIQGCANFRDSGASDFRFNPGCAFEAHFRHAVDEQGAEAQLRKFCIFAATRLSNRGLESAELSTRIKGVLKDSNSLEHAFV
jgi:hypothetical protein